MSSKQRLILYTACLIVMVGLMTILAQMQTKVKHMNDTLDAIDTQISQIGTAEPSYQLPLIATVTPAFDGQRMWVMVRKISYDNGVPVSVTGEVHIQVPPRQGYTFANTVYNNDESRITISWAAGNRFDSQYFEGLKVEVNGKTLPLIIDGVYTGPNE